MLLRMSMYKSNVRKVTDFMELGSPLRQAFVMEAISRYAKECKANEQALRQQMEGGFVPAEGWLKCAEDWLVEETN